MKNIIENKPSKRTMLLLKSFCIITFIIVLIAIIFKPYNAKFWYFSSVIFLLNFILLFFSIRSDKPEPPQNTPKEFEEIYSNFINNLSLKTLEFTSTLSLVTMILLILFVFTTIVVHNTILKIIFFVFSIICLYISIKAYLINKKEYTKNIIPKFVKLYNSDFKYNPTPNKLTEQQIIVSSCFHSSLYNYYFYDTLDGFIAQNIPFHLSDVNITKKNSNPEDSNLVFNGIFAYINCNKNINSEIFITSNFSLKEKNKLELDDYIFEKIFDVRSTNELLTMQILTHEVMETLVDLYKKFDLRFSINIKNDKIYFEISCTQLFKHSTFYKYLNKQTFFDCYNVLELFKELSTTMYSIIQDIEL